MKSPMKTFILSAISIIILFQNNYAQFTELCDSSIDVLGGEYRIYNNVWGTGEGVGDQCIDVSADSTYFSVTMSTHNSGEVASYPFILKGCHFGDCTDSLNPMPIKAEEISSAPFTWKVNTEGASGSWNTSFEAWFSAGSNSFFYDGELMIWIDYSGTAAPAGNKVDKVEIGGHQWDLYFAPWDSWNYMAYRIVEPADSVSLDLKDFIHDAITRGYILATWYMHNMEAGFEIWSDGQGLTTHSFSASVTGGASPVNYPPVSFKLSYPYNNRILDSLTIPFNWEATIDPNEDTVTYSLYLTGNDVDTSLTNLEQPGFIFDGQDILTYDTEYTWYVEASDGIDTTESEHRTFTIELPNGLKQFYKETEEHILHQNYPNPSGISTCIDYEIKTPGFIRLALYDVSGRNIKTIVNNYRQPDNYSVNVNLRDLPGGIYYYKLQVNEVTVGIKKLIVIKE
jgi:hypothetical protein